jgi:hypothetical protein
METRHLLHKMMATSVMSMIAVSGMANDYTDNLEVNIDGSATSQQLPSVWTSRRMAALH